MATKTKTKSEKHKEIELQVLERNFEMGAELTLDEVQRLAEAFSKQLEEAAQRTVDLRTKQEMLEKTRAPQLRLNALTKAMDKLIEAEETMGAARQLLSQKSLMLINDPMVSKLGNLRQSLTALIDEVEDQRATAEETVLKTVKSTAKPKGERS